jgi:hypothetical protein
MKDFDKELEGDDLGGEAVVDQSDSDAGDDEGW